MEIQSNSDPSDWHHCSGRENPADYVSRGANLETIINSQFWMHGPQWLRNELIRVGGRLHRCKFSYLQKLRTILPAKHYFVNLIVQDSHDKAFHGGFSETLLEVRERFWLIKRRQTVKNIFKNVCFVKDSARLQVCSSDCTPLPALRIEQSAPFSVVGIDFGGPLYTKEENKHYIALFTCAVTRALHLELVNNLITETFLLALRRFISRRELRSKILTDNAKTFKRSELELKNLWKERSCSESVVRFP
ncbi:integrase catalytic domain-containing protein [Trichonephila clavipes]|nr:integrase catalytic domain-containing protein [Trichonephila clavipes]